MNGSPAVDIDGLINFSLYSGGITIVLYTIFQRGNILYKKCKVLLINIITFWVFILLFLWFISRVKYTIIYSKPLTLEMIAHIIYLLEKLCVLAF